MNKEKMAENFRKTIELIDLSEELSVGMIMSKHPEMSRREAEIFFRKEARRVKDITLEKLKNEAGP